MTTLQKIYRTVALMVLLGLTLGVTVGLLYSYVFAEVTRIEEGKLSVGESQNSEYTQRIYGLASLGYIGARGVQLIGVAADLPALIIERGRVGIGTKYPSSALKIVRGDLNIDGTILSTEYGECPEGSVTFAVEWDYRSCYDEYCNSSCYVSPEWTRPGSNNAPYCYFNKFSEGNGGYCDSEECPADTVYRSFCVSVPD